VIPFKIRSGRSAQTAIQRWNIFTPEFHTGRPVVHLQRGATSDCPIRRRDPAAWPSPSSESNDPTPPTDQSAINQIDLAENSTTPENSYNPLLLNVV